MQRNLFQPFERFEGENNLQFGNKYLCSYRGQLLACAADGFERRDAKSFIYKVKWFQR
jgi:hypothetical protein